MWNKRAANIKCSADVILSASVLSNLGIKQVPFENTAKFLLHKYKINKEKAFRTLLGLQDNE
jgi:arylamine N-acetyltransferase